MMKHVLVIFTGGTIGSSYGESIDIDAYSKYRLIELYKKRFGQTVSFDILEPLSVLSENMTADTLGRLLCAIASVDFGRYDGVIVTHGSDTLSYTSAFAGLLFGHIGKPVVFIAANKPLENPSSNGFDNFIGAVDFILNAGLSGVFTIYKNRETVDVFLATRILEADSDEECFGAFGGAPFGRMESGAFVRNDFAQNPLPDDFGAVSEPMPPLEPFDKNILIIKPYVGLDYRFFDITARQPAAVLHLAYHSGTGCTGGTDTSILTFAKRLREQGIPMYMLPFRTEEEHRYATAQRMIEGGLCLPLRKMSLESAYAKLVLAYHFYRGDQHYINKNVFFEYLS